MEGPLRGLRPETSVHDLAESRLTTERRREYLREFNADLFYVEQRTERRIARVLHDELGQTLAAARMAICRLREAEGSAARAGSLEELRAHLDRAIEVTRSFAF